MNCGALRAISDEVQMQSVAENATNQQRKMHSMPRNTQPPQQLHLQQQQQQLLPHNPQQAPQTTTALRRSTMPRGRGLASCLRGERDDAPTPPIHEVHCDVQQLQMLQQPQQLQQEQLLHQQDRISGGGSAASTLENAGRSK